MMKMISRYKVFLLLALANIIIGLIMPGIGLKSLDLTRANLLEMMSVIPPIFILLGLLDVWVDRSTMIRLTGNEIGRAHV